MADRFRQLLTPVDIDKKLALILFGLGLTLLILATAVFKAPFLVQVSVTLALASGVYLLLHKRRRARSAKGDITEAQSVPLLQPRFSQLLDIAFWGMLIASLLLISQQAYVRPLSFLVLVSIMSAILGIQIFTNQNSAYCLVKILIIGILLRASVWYQFPSPVGRDPIIELDYVRQLMAIGHVGEHMGSYMAYPVAHILTASSSFVTGLGLKDSFFILGIIEVMSLVFLFLIGRELFDKKVGLLAALIMAVCNWHILWGFWMKGMTLSVAWLPILFFLLLASRRKAMRFPLVIFSIVIIFLIILTHTVSSLVILTILIMAWLSFLICKGLPSKEKFEPPVTLTIVLLFSTALLCYWTYVSGMIGYVGTVVKYALSFDVAVEQPIVLYRSSGVLILQKLPVLMSIFLAILGCLSIFNIQKLDRKTLSQVWLVPIVGTMVVLTFLLNYIGAFGALIPSRWFVFMSLLIAVPAAIGLLSMLGRKGWRNLGVLFLLLFLFSGIMTTSHEANITQVVPWVIHSRDAFTNSEMTAAKTVSQKAELTPGQTPQGETKIHTDYLYRLLLGYEFHVPHKKMVDASPIFKGELTEYHGILLLRSTVTDTVLMTYETSHYCSKVEQSQYQSLVDDPQAILIYDNGVVRALKRP